jgi:hypothetical protein
MIEEGGVSILEAEGFENPLDYQFMVELRTTEDGKRELMPICAASMKTDNGFLKVIPLHHVYVLKIPMDLDPEIIFVKTNNFRKSIRHCKRQGRIQQSLSKTSEFDEEML